MSVGREREPRLCTGVLESTCAPRGLSDSEVVRGSHLSETVRSNVVLTVTFPQGELTRESEACLLLLSSLPGGVADPTPHITSRFRQPCMGCFLLLKISLVCTREVGGRNYLLEPAICASLLCQVCAGRLTAPVGFLPWVQGYMTSRSHPVNGGDAGNGHSPPGFLRGGQHGSGPPARHPTEVPLTGVVGTTKSAP